MSDEIDRLEIVVEAEANKANRALSGMEKRLDKITESLARLMALAGSGIVPDFKTDTVNREVAKLGKGMADTLIKNFNLKKAGSNVVNQAKQLSNDIAKSLQTGKMDDASRAQEKLFDLLKKNGSMASSTSGDYKKLYEWISKASKINIGPETAKSLGDSWKERPGIMRSKFGTGSDGVSLDSIYEELSSQNSGVLPSLANEEDQFHAVSKAIREYYKEKERAFSKPDNFDDIVASSVVDEVEELAKEIKTAERNADNLCKAMGRVDSMSDLVNSNKSVTGRIDSIAGQMGNMVAPAKADLSRIPRADIKYPSATSDSLKKKFNMSSFDKDFSSMGMKELRTELTALKRGYNRVNQEIADMIELSGSNTLSGKAWYKAHQKLMQYENGIDSATEALGRLNVKAANVSGMKINKGSSEHSDTVGSQEKTANSGGYMKYNSGDIQKYVDDFEKGTVEGNTFEAQIKRIKKELSGLTVKGFSQGDSEYDEVARELAEVTEAKRRYDAEMKRSAKASLDKDAARILEQQEDSLRKSAKQANVFKRALNGVNSVVKKINKTQTGFNNLRKSIASVRGAAKSTLHPLKALRKLIAGVQKQGNKGMTLGRMVGSSILFSTVFQTLNAIKTAIADGSNNLVQYSSEYNKTISSMVSSLTYLKNAWAAAFAPIINVVGPYISAFISMIGDALNAVARLMAALTGKSQVAVAKKVTQNYAAGISAAGGAAGGAADKMEEYKRSLMGFDKINKLDAPDTSSGSGGGGGGGGADLAPSDMFETVEVDSGYSDIAKQIKEAWESADFTGIGKIVGDKLNSALEDINWTKIKKTSKKVAKSIATFLNGFIEKSDWKLVGKTLSEGLNTGIEFAYTSVTTFDWAKFGQAIGNSINGFVKNIDFKKFAKTLSDGFKGLAGTVAEALNETDFREIGKKIGEFITNIDWLDIAGSLVMVLVEAFDAALMTAGGLIEGLATGIWEVIKNSVPKIDLMVDIIGDKWNEFLKDCQEDYEVGVSLIKENWKKLKDFIGDKVEVGIELFKDGWKKLEKFVGNAVDVSISLLKKGWSKISAFVGTAVSVYTSLLKKGWSSISSFIGTAVNVFTSLKKNGWSTISAFVGTAASVSIKLLKSGWSTIKKWLGIDSGLKIGLKLPKVSVQWVKKSMLGVSINVPKFTASFATGGFPEEGPFMMNRGEIAGRFSNGKSVVANNKQITDGISSAVGPAVYNAVLAAMSQVDMGGGIADIRLVGDAKGLFEVVRDEADKYVRTTGEPAFVL